MPSTRKMTTKSGKVFYEISVSRGRGKSRLTRRWYAPVGWSKKAIERELAAVSAEFERQCDAGEAISRAEQHEKDAREAAEAAAKAAQQAAKGAYLDTPKSGRIRVVYASDDTMALLRQLRIEQAKKAVSAFVFTKEGSPEPMHPQSPTRYLKKLSERSDIPDLHPHKLRHTFASIAITNGADVASVSEVLGHSDKAVTLRMYTHADQESMKRAAAITQEAIKKAGQG